jgi:serine/threonine protein kinase/Tol biopolymer transport system component
MSGDRAAWDRVKQIFQAVLEMPLEQRPGALDDACGTDRELRAEVESLLAAHHGAGAFAERAAIHALASSPMPPVESIVASADAAFGPDHRIDPSQSDESPQARFSTGSLLGHYEVLSSIGKGGMGEVFRARDIDLGRDVAIKVLPQAFGADADRLARFEREARLLASLNHPHIATLYGLERSGDTRFLVMELVPGETLAEILQRRPMSLDEALGVFQQIADALEAAHERGVVHRDLKPANVMVTPARNVKVLDFGLAKGFATPSGAAESTELAQSPDSTVAGVILGTAAYMSPEQARGQIVDRRTDVWSFGCVFFEALTGERPFRGATVSDTIAAVLEREPDWSRLPHGTPNRIRELLRRCLQKDASRRLRDMGDIRLELEETPAAPEPATAYPQQSRSLSTWAAAVLGASAGVLVMLPASWQELFWEPANKPPIRFTLHAPSDVTPAIAPYFQQNTGLALSQQGTHLAYSGRAADGQSSIYLQALEQLEPYRIAGTEGGFSPFFSPDGQWVAFFTDDALKIVSILGGAPLRLGSVPPVSRGGSWSGDGTIVYSPAFHDGLFGLAVATSGISPERFPIKPEPYPGGEIVHRDPAKRQSGLLWPQVLPSGSAVLFTVWTGSSFDNAQIAIARLPSGEPRMLINSGSHGRYVVSGHIVFARGRSLLAVPFDLNRLGVSGAPVPVLEQILTSNATGAASFDVSGNGTLAYVPATNWADRPLIWIDRDGTSTPVSLAKREFSNPRLSPDGRQLVVQINNDLWILDLDGDSLRLLTPDGMNQYPVWSPDGKHIAYSYSKGTNPTINIRAADGSGTANQIADKAVAFPSSWSPDGKVLAYSRTLGATFDWDVYGIQVDADSQPRLIIGGPHNQLQAMFSPDGRWLAYVSDEDGQHEVYVTPYPGIGPKRKMSNQGGTEPLWAPGGRELYYRQGQELMVVPFVARVAGKPRRVLTMPKMLEVPQPGYTSYDTRDGRRFVMVGPNDPALAPRRIVVTLNWLDELRKRVPR